MLRYAYFYSISTKNYVMTIGEHEIYPKSTLYHKIAGKIHYDTFMRHLKRELDDRFHYTEKQWALFRKRTFFLAKEVKVAMEVFGSVGS